MTTRSLLSSSCACVVLAVASIAAPALASDATASDASASEAAARAASANEENAQVASDNSEEREAEMEEKAGGTKARRSYTPEDFSRFAPRSALDMARQIPGFSIQQGDGARGLGQADTNVLINGRRISGKSNGPVEALQRIPTEEVVRLEIVDGASLDIGGLTGQVLNVITASSGGISGQFRYAPQFRTFGTDPRLYEGRVSLAGGGAKTDWTLALENNSNRRGDEGPEFVFDADGNLIETREEIRTSNSERIDLSGSFTRIASNGNVLNLTGVVGGNIREEDEKSSRFDPEEQVDTLRDFLTTEDEFNFEFGVDYRFGLGAGDLKLIAFHGYEDSPTTSSATTIFSDNRPLEGTRFIRDADEGETILRTEYSTKGLGGNLLFAAEGVRNFLDITSALKVRDVAGDLQPVPLPGATSRVDEDRAEIQATYSRSLTTSLQLQMSLGSEYSRISQSGVQGQTRTFYRPKGFVSLDWRAAQGVNIAARVERLVGQLNFFDFIASVDLDQDRTDVTNADLVPQQSWRLEIEANIALGALGSLNIRPFFEDIVDIVDQIPIDGGGQAPGNLPSAQRYGVDTDVTLLSEGLGWRGSRLDVSFGLFGSSVADPLLGFDRELSGNQLVSFNSDIRHDLQGTDWAFGGSAFWDYSADNVRLDEISVRNDSFAFVSAFIENKDVGGLTLRTSVSNLIDRKNRFERTVFLDRSAGIVDFSENRERRFGMIFTFEVEGSF